MLPELFDYYTAAIEAMADHEDDDRIRASTPNKALATHLMTYFLRGQLELEENGLVDCLFQGGSSKTLGYVMESIGRGLRESAKGSHGAACTALGMALRIRRNHSS